MARQRKLDGYRPFPVEHKLSTRFFDPAGFRGVTKRQKYGLVSNEVVSYTSGIYVQQSTRLSFVRLGSWKHLHLRKSPSNYTW